MASSERVSSSDSNEDNTDMSAHEQEIGFFNDDISFS